MLKLFSLLGSHTARFCSQNGVIFDEYLALSQK